jgi:MoaA/NifB/PqqE/SkfB family radical SAM enzyme
VSDGIYSELKPAWWFLHEGRVPHAPKQVQLILSDLCNQNCSFCAYRMDGYTSNQMFVGDSEKARYGHNNPKRFIPTAKAMEILQDAKNNGVLGIQFTGGGEPTVHPDHEAIFQRALELGLKCALVSNGVSWSDPLIAMLPQFAWVRMSLDAGTAETYAKIRDTSPNSFNKVLKNLGRVSHAIKSGIPSPCTLGVGYVVVPDNWQEIGIGTALAKEFGAHYIRLSAIFSVDGVEPYRSNYGEIKETIHTARERNECDTFKVHDFFGDRIDDMEQGAPDYQTCYYQHYNTFIGGDQNVYRCCILAYNKRGLLGSLKDTTYDAFLKNPEVQDKLTNFDARGCDRCQFNQKNRAMNYLLGGKPPHAEFP